MSYTIQISKSAQKELHKVSNVYYKSIVNHIQSLADDPYPYGYKKLQGSEDLYRIRVGIYRIIYSIDNNILNIQILKVGHRKDIYK